MKNINEYETYGDELFLECYRTSCQRIDETYQQQGDKMKVAFLGFMNQLFEQGIEQQRLASKGKIQMIAFFYLHSSYLMGTDEIQVQLFDENLYLDSQEVFGLFYPSFVMKQYRQDLALMKTKLKQQVIGVRERHLRQLPRKYGFYYFLIAMKYCQEWMADVIQLESYQLLAKCSDLAITFGEYMGEQRSFYSGSMKVRTDVKLLNS